MNLIIKSLYNAIKNSDITLFPYSVSVICPENVTDVTKSNLTGINLPAGSKQDKRILATVAAADPVQSAAIADSFIFTAADDYSSKHSGASGMVGNMQTYNQEYKGKATVTDWEITLTNRWKDETDVFEAWFEVVRGGRVLRLIDKNARGMTYNLVRIKN